jgi:acetyl esterase/lipase
MRLTRRGVLTCGAAAAAGVAGAGALVEFEVLPGRGRAYDFLGLNGEAGVIPDVEGGPVDRGTLDGANWAVFNPPNGRPGLPVVVALHGAGQGIDQLVDNLALDKFLAASGGQFALAAIEGGRSYWHPRADGTDAGGRVLDRFLPLLGDRGFDVRRPGFMGWSMGGYGALLLASERVERGLSVGPVLAISPAVWEDYDDTSPASFDDVEDFAAYGMFARRDLLEGIDVRIDCGRGDPFYGNAKDFADGLDAELHIEAGAHNDAYWTRVLPEQLTWLGDRISTLDRE